MNTVNPDNFNETMKGYIVRALKEMNADKDLADRFFNGLNWAIDEMAMSQAREEYKKYCKGQIDFKDGE
jgi:hypothetical protein